MVVSALLFGLLVGLLIASIALALRRLLRAEIRKSNAHTEARPTLSTSPPIPSLPQAQQPVPVPPPAAESKGPVKALITYTKVDGSMRVRSLTIYSRNLRDGQTHSLNCRQDGERITKQFLLSGIGRLELPDQIPALCLSSPEEIRAWLERCIPESSPASQRSQRPAPSAGVAPERVADLPQAVLRSVIPPPPPPPPPPAVKAVTPLSDLLPDGAKGFAVLDLETTGTGRSCRIVEIALVRLDPQGRITEEWETLVRPGIPIPNVHIHGIDDSLVAGAPSFLEIAGSLASKLHQHVLVAHNLCSFDGPILEAHFADVDEVDLNLGDGLDTMPTPKVKLVDLCARHGVELNPGVAHTALGDTRALAKALQGGMAHLQPAGSAVVVHRNGLISQPARILTRAMTAIVKFNSGWMAVTVQLEVGQVFVTTGPQSMKADTEIKRAEAHGCRIGLSYRKVKAIPKRNPPAFLLSTSLKLATRKMGDARETQLPVVLCSDFMNARMGNSVRAWKYMG